MTDAPVAAPQAYEFRAEIRQLLNILAHSLYTEREIFLRELISNASDALHRMQFEMLTNRDVLDAEVELSVRLSCDAERHTLTVSDTGTGMTREELVENLGTIAHSGALAFLQKTQKEGGTITQDLIGQFGVGFYSVFMVADEVRVTSRSYRQDAEAYTWISRGDNTYTLEPAERPARGTSVTLYLKEDAYDFAQMHRLEQIIRKHSDFVPFPIYAAERTEPVNQRTALWRRAAREVTAEQYDEFYKQFTLDFSAPLAHIHINTDAPVQAYALLYVPAKREKGMLSLRTEPGLKLYSRKVLIQEYHKELLPNHFRFIEGVVDSEDLPLNVSREGVQTDTRRVMERLRTLLTRKVQSELEDLADKNPDSYRTFWQQFGSFIKEGLATDAAARNDLAKLVRFHSTESGEQALVSLKEYVARMPADQPAIYFVLGSDLKSVARSPHLDPLRKRHYEVLYWVEPIDSFLTAGMRDFDGKPLRNVDDPDLGLPPESADAEATLAGPVVADDVFAQLVERCKQVLGERVADVRAGTYLTDSPVRLVSPADSPDRDMQHVRRLLEQDYQLPKKIMELNRSHALVHNLAGLLERDTDLVDVCIEQLYANGLLVEGLHPDPAEMIGRLERLMQAATRTG